MKKLNILRLFSSAVCLVSIFLAQAGLLWPPFEASAQSSSSPMPDAPVFGTCPAFPQNNYWNTPVDNLPVHPLSAAWVNSIGANTGFHMDFGSGTWAGGPIGIPYNLLSGSTVTKYNVSFYYPSESDPGPYPIPSNPKQEYGSDHHILIVDTDDCKLYEMYDAWKSGNAWFGGSGAIWDLNVNQLRPDTWTSGDAAGLPILPGLARYEEVAAGVIQHALRFTSNCTANYYIWPARHVAQYGSCATPPPFGARFRLKASYDISGFSPQARILLQAMKTYGIVLADNGAPWYVTGSPSESWNNTVLHEIDVVEGKDFEAVDTSGLMIDYDSAATNYYAQGTQISAHPANLTIDKSASFSFSRAPGTFTYECQLDTAAFAACTSPAAYTGLSTGIHQFTVRAVDGSSILDAAPPSFTWEIQPFWDVPNSYWAANFIDRLSNAGITLGCGGGYYCPEQPVTRAQMAVFLERGMRGAAYDPGTPNITFTDTAIHWARYWIELLRADGITVGCGPDLYCPESSVTRDQMAVFLLRAMYGPNYTPPHVENRFLDVPPNHWAADWIEQLATEGITTGCGTNLYCPSSPVTRSQMAVFLVRTFHLP